MIHVICAAYQRIIPLRILIDSFLIQSDERWKLNIIHDGEAPFEMVKMVSQLKDNRIIFIETEKRNECFGHPNRKKLLEKIEGEPNDFVLMTNDDNYYVPLFVEKMLKAVTHKVGVVCCNTVHSHLDYLAHGSLLVENGIDMGAFIVRFDISKSVGFNWTHHGADGSYALACNSYCVENKLDIVNIPNLLFIHN